MAKLIGMRGEVKNKIISFSVASIVVIGLLLMPSFIDPIILDVLPLQCLKEDDELVQYLRSVQDDDSVFVGLHGWEHKCPITGEDFCEFYNPNPEVSIPTKILEEKFEKGFSCFKSAGLKMEWFSFPGMEYDNRSLAILEERGFIPLVWAKKKKYAALLPLYGLYQLMLNGFLFLLLMAWLTRRGVTVRYGGKNIHAL